MQTKEVGNFLFSEDKIIFQVSAKSPIELLYINKSSASAKKGHWDVQDHDIKKDIKTGNLIFDLTWKSETNPAPKKISESIEVIYASKKLKKEIHDIIKPKGEIALEGFLLSYEISKISDEGAMKIKFTSKQSISLHDLQILSDDNKSIGFSMEFWLLESLVHGAVFGGGCFTSTIHFTPEEVKQVKKVSFTYYPAPYKTVKIPLEATLPLK